MLSFLFIDYFCQGNQNVSALNYSSCLGVNKNDGGSFISGAQITEGLPSWQEFLPDPAAGIVVYNTIHTQLPIQTIACFFTGLANMLPLNRRDCLWTRITVFSSCPGQLAGA